MKYNASIQIIALILSILFTLPIIAGVDQEGKIRVTSTSGKALEYFLRGRELQESLQGQESIQYFEKAVAEDPGFAMGYMYLSFVTPSATGFFETFAKAKENLDNVSEGERLWILGVDAGVNAYTMKQRELYTKLVEKYPKDERALNLLGTHYFAQQDYQKAVEYYTKAIKINPEFSPPYNQLGYAQRFLGNYAEAEKAFKKYIELIPEDPNPYDSYAELQMKMGNYEKSIEFYKKALVYNPNFVASHIGIATNLNYLDKYEAARIQLKKLLEIARNDAEKRAAHFTMAVSYADEGRMELAIEEIQNQYKIAQATNDEAAMAGDNVIIGNLYLEQGQPDDAFKYYEEAIKIIKKSDLSDEVKNNFQRGYLYNTTRAALLKNDLKMAKNKVRKHRKMVEEIENPFQLRLTHELLGMIALAERDYEDAIEEFEQANLQNPYNLYRLSVAYKGTQNIEKNKEYYKRALGYNALNNMNYAFIRARTRQATIE
jgi:tetratricopeptide (TPR) repeat protein